MTDNLYDGSVKHWTGKDFPLIGALKVDGVAYRFMGTEDLELLPVVPTSEQGEWVGRWTTVKPAGDWEGALLRRRFVEERPRGLRHEDQRTYGQDRLDDRKHLGCAAR